MDIKKCSNGLIIIKCEKTKNALHIYINDISQYYLESLSFGKSCGIEHLCDMINNYIHDNRYDFLSYTTISDIDLLTCEMEYYFSTDISICRNDIVYDIRTGLVKHFKKEYKKKMEIIRIEYVTDSSNEVMFDFFGNKKYRL